MSAIPSLTLPCIVVTGKMNLVDLAGSENNKVSVLLLDSSPSVLMLE